MIITCEKCGGSFKLDENLLKPGGTKLQCSKCKHIFRAFPPGEKGPAQGLAEIELIVCEQCGAGFKMKSALLDLGGTKVRCSKCKHIFLAYPSSAGPAPKEEETGIEEPDVGHQDFQQEDQSGGLDFSLDEESVDDTAGFSDDMDLALEEDSSETEPSGSSGDLELSLDEDDADELDLDLEEGSSEDEPSGSSGDLELALDDDDADDDLELDIDDESQEAEAEESSDLELSLDDDDDNEEEIDFSEVDNLLGSDDVAVADTVEVSADELALDLDLDDEGGGSAGGIQQQEIDLADLEQTIEMELLEPEEDKGDEEPEDVELALADDEEEEDLDEEMALGEEEDFSDIEEMLAVGEDEETIELDLEGEGEEENAEAEEGEEATAKGKKKKEKKAKAKKEKKPKEKKAKADKAGEKSSKKGLIIALIVILVLIALGAGGFWYVSNTGGFSSLFGSGEAVPARNGGVSVMENTIQSDFVDNAKHGKLFIIKGNVKNESSVPQRFIKVVANLYSEGHTLEMTSSAYCGNILSSEELTTRDLPAIDARLAVQVGDNGRNASVKPGSMIPFMIVIPELPENLVEYEVRVSDFSPVS